MVAEYVLSGAIYSGMPTVLRVHQDLQKLVVRGKEVIQHAHANALMVTKADKIKLLKATEGY